ncbi:hypothetical protein [Cupriavidus nantongensis]|uniref:Uncharacterized protein n=1 Tax=Cupriavidus nantongensis TaxID=1796606 RepID=A0A142JMY7_9BURK|nr:hypothetical protein [Cupriavidus nantongensis]AMR79449.1 hypothetical protein A2G96_17825 [Cupriavidus nantongensis]
MPIDNMLQPRIGALHSGVNRQAPLLRSPSSMEEIVNFLPSVEVGGLVDRMGTKWIAGLNRTSYALTGHTMFRTKDGQPWVMLKRAEAGQIEVRNLVTGDIAPVTYGPWVQNYLGDGSTLRFLPVTDTVFILNTAVTATVTETAKPALTRAYVVVKKLNSASQSFYLSSNVGSASVFYDGSGGAKTRDWVASQLAAAIGANMPGLFVSRINNVIRIEGPTNIVSTLSGSNDWDETAMTVLKQRASVITDLPNVGFHGEPILIDQNQGDLKSSYYVAYDQPTNAYRECSYLDAFGTSGRIEPGTMPIRLHQTGANSFELQPCDWTLRKTGDADSNAPPPFAGKQITDMALWKGRLWLAADDWIIGSQPDDLFNFWNASAREIVASDPVPLQADADSGKIRYLRAIRNSLIVVTESAQAAVDGGQAITPMDASMGVVTRYELDGECPPQVVGDVLYYTGSSEGRSVLWEYSYREASQNNYAEDMSKHVPDYCPGAVRRISGSAQAGRNFLWTGLAPNKLWVQTNYWKDAQRQQNAWATLAFDGVSYIRLHWVDKGWLYLLADVGNYVQLLKVSIEAVQSLDAQRLDFLVPAQITWNVARNRSEVIVPTPLAGLDNMVVLVPNDSGWYSEYPATVVWDGSQHVAHFQTHVTAPQGFLGRRFERYWTFSPFYPAAGESQTPMGRLQVHKVFLDALRAGDFKATVVRKDRPPMVVQLSPRVVGEALVADNGENQTFGIPFNAQGHKAQLTVSTTSSAPMAVTGYTLAARYANLFASQ